MKIERFEDIGAWQLARELTRKVYRLSKKAYFEKDYISTDEFQDLYEQARRARAAVRGFINHPKKYQTRVEQITVNREP